MQMLRFGQTIDLEAMDKVSTNKTLVELNDNIRSLEIKHDSEQRRKRREMQIVQERLLQGTQDNTATLEVIAERTHTQHRLEHELNATSAGGSSSDDNGSMRKEMEERNRIVQLVKLQAKEVDALKAEINMLRRKGGHVYTPAVQQGGGGGTDGPAG